MVSHLAGATRRADAQFAACWIARRTTSAWQKCLRIAKDYDHVIINTSTPSLKNDCKVAEAIKAQKPDTKIGFVGAHTMVLPTETLKASPAIDWVGRKEFDFTCKEVAEDRDLATIAGLSYKDKDGKIKHNPEREMIQDMDTLPWVADVYKRDLQIEKYFIGYLLHPYISMYTGRGCPAQCTFCLWPQTIGGHKYRVRSPQNVADEMAYMKKIFPQVREFFFDDDTFTANLPRAREIAKKLGPLGVHWSCNSRANLDYDTIKSFKDNGLRLFLVGYESGNDDILTRIKKGVTMDEMRRFTKNLPSRRAWSFTARSFWACRWKRRRPSRTPSILRRNWTCSACKFRSPRRIPARNFTKWPSKTAGS